MARKRDKIDESISNDNSFQSLAAQCQGSVVEVLTEDNRLLFVGTLSEYELRNDEVRLDLHRGDETPQGVMYNTRVKIQAHRWHRRGELVMFYGVVIICASDHWRVKVTSGMSCVDNRRAFRQPVHVEGEITWGEEEEFRQSCRLEDISLVGVAFSTKADLEKDELVRLTIPHLLKGGAGHSLLCRVVVRRESTRGPGLWRYGCNYERLGKRQEDILCRDIFNLQAKNMNRER